MVDYKTTIEGFKKVGRMTFLSRLNNTHSGNMSMRVGDRMFITAKGAMLGFLKDEDIIEIGIDEVSRKIELASTEFYVHRSILKNTNHPAVLHCHPLMSIVMSFRYDELIPLDVESSYYLKKIPIIEFEKPYASKEMEENLPVVLNEHHAVIVRGHGTFCVGKNLEEALYYTNIVEQTAGMIYIKETLGK